MAFSSSSARFEPSRHPATGPGPIREAVALFMTADDLQEAIRALEGTDFPRDSISVMGSETDLQKVFGTGTVAPPLAMDNSLTPRTAPSRPEEQTIGAAAMVGIPAYVGAMTLALAAGAVAFPATIAAAVLGGIGGGAVGAILTKVMGDRYTHHIEDQLRQGGLLLWVRTPDAEKEDLALQILKAHGGREAHVHDID